MAPIFSADMSHCFAVTREKGSNVSLSSLARTTLGAKPRANISAQDAAAIVHDKEPKERQYRSAFLFASNISFHCVV